MVKIVVERRPQDLDLSVGGRVTRRPHLLGIQINSSANGGKFMQSGYYGIMAAAKSFGGAFLWLKGHLSTTKNI